MSKCDEIYVKSCFHTCKTLFTLASMFQGKFGDAAGHLRNCLQAIGRPLPTSKIDLISSLFWHSLRQILHRVYIGQWFSKHAGFWNRMTNQEVKDSARDAALVYHKLHQLHLTGKFHHIERCRSDEVRCLN